MSELAPTLLSLADNTARRFGLGARPLDAAELIDEAERRAGRRFQSGDFEPGLRVLIEALEQEAQLSLFGRLSTRWDVRRLLANRLRFDAAEAEDPSIVRSAVPAPLFITGLPRSGTTFLHMLMAQDPKNRVVWSWQTLLPYPEARDRRRDRRVQRVERQLAAFRQIAPDVGDLHPIGATTPQECTEITSHLFESLRFDTTYEVPSYLTWLERRGHVAAFRFHKRFLQHLQAQEGPAAWVLKCPDHVFALRAIQEVYPDARFVFVHRDPAAVIPSVAKLTQVLRAPFTRRLDPIGIGATVSARWAEGAQRILAAAGMLPARRVLHLHHRQVTTEPQATLERLYRHFEMPFTASARQRVARFVARRPRGGYGENRYDPAEFGLDLARLRERFEAYTRTFAVAAPRATPA